MSDSTDSDGLSGGGVGVRTNAEQNLTRLRNELAALRELHSSKRDVDSVTEQIALRQEADTLRHTLREKERLIEVTAAQCRRLEDDLEDQRIAYDRLKQELGKKKLLLASAHEDEVRSSAEGQDLEERSLSLLNGAGHQAEVIAGAPAVGTFRPKPWWTAVDGRFLVGLVTGTLLVMMMAAGFLRPELLTFGDAQLLSNEEASAPVDVPVEESPLAGATSTEDGATPARSSKEMDTVPSVVRTVRDPLRVGGAAPLMLEVRGGKFSMGKLRALPNDDAGPAREVNVSDFLIGASEVTFDEYDDYVRFGGGRSPNDFGWGRGRRPVVGVSWEDARAYVDWLSRQTGHRYRLPTEAEWEYAAAAGQRSAFWWGHRPEQERAVCFDCGTAWDNISTAPVGTFEPNQLGLYDTAGNAMEWVQDCYHPNYVGAPIDSEPWDERSCRFRVARGGAFNKPARSMQSTARNHFVPETRLSMIGFRVARDQ